MFIKQIALMCLLLAANCAMGAVTLNRETTLTDRAPYFTEGYFSKPISLHGDCLDVVWYKGGMSSGAWFDVPNGNVSPANITPSLPSAFYRLITQ